MGKSQAARYTLDNLQNLINAEKDKLDPKTFKQFQDLLQQIYDNNDFVEQESLKAIQSIRTMENYLSSVEQVEELLDN